MKLRIGNPNATGQTINGRLLQQWQREMSSIPVDIEFLQEIHTAGLTPIKVTGTMDTMFYNLYGLKTIDLSKFATSEVTDMTQLFYFNSNLTHLDISNFDSQSLQGVDHIFLGSNSLKILSLG